MRETGLKVSWLPASPDGDVAAAAAAVQPLLEAPNWPVLPKMV